LSNICYFLWRNSIVDVGILFPGRPQISHDCPGKKGSQTHKNSITVNRWLWRQVSLQRWGQRLRFRMELRRRRSGQWRRIRIRLLAILQHHEHLRRRIDLETWWWRARSSSSSSSSSSSASTFPPPPHHMGRRFWGWWEYPCRQGRRLSPPESFVMDAARVLRLVLLLFLNGRIHRGKIRQVKSIRIRNGH
jgi:hypothetical protein